MDVINLFNQKTLAFLWNSSDLDRYMETGELPYVEVGKEGFEEKIPNEWEWYNPLQQPRQFFFGFGLEF